MTPVAGAWVRRALLAAVAARVLAGCSEPPPPLVQQAYVWQQAWTPALGASLQGPVAEGLGGWRVLIGEQLAAEPAPRWRDVLPDWPALAASGQPLTAVLRLDAQLTGLDGTAAAQREAIVARWRAAQQAAGRPLALELDHDCATRRLPAYAGFLRALRAEVHAHGGHLSITALPAWLARPEALREVLAAVDSHVLQVHAVSRPEAGLWSAERSLAWLHDWARLAPHPFALALPSVGSLVRVSASGTVLAVQSSQPSAARDWPADSQALSLMPEPRALAAFLQQLQAQRPARLQGVVWFRWPLAGDAQAFTPESWSLLRRDPAAFLAASRAAPLRWQSEDAEPGSALRRWSLTNVSAVDQALPAQVTLPDGCQPPLPLGAAALAAGTTLRLSRSPAEVRLLAPGQRLAVALAHCPPMLTETPVP